LSLDQQAASMDLETSSAIVHRVNGVTLRHGASADIADDDSSVSIGAESLALKKGKAILTLNRDTIRITLSDATGITITPSTVNIGSELTVQGDTVSNNITSLKQSVEGNKKAVAKKLKEQEDRLKKLDDQIKADSKKYEELLKKRSKEN
jgi:hypothetical protein